MNETNDANFDAQFRQALARPVDPELIRKFAVQRATQLAVQGQVVRAELKVSALIADFEARDPKSEDESNLSLSLGRCYHGLGLMHWYAAQYERAVGAFQSAYPYFQQWRFRQRAVASNTAAALRELGILDDNLRNTFKDALAWPTSTLDGVTGDALRDRLLDLIALGLLNFALDHNDEAKECWLKVVQKVEKSNVDEEKNHAYRALLNLAGLEIQEGELDDAQDYLERANKVRPGGSSAGTPLARDYLLTKTDLLMARKKESQARSLLTKLRRQSPLDPEPIYRLGLIEAKDGHASEAATLFQTTLAIAATHPKAQADLSATQGTRWRAWSFHWYRGRSLRL